MLHHTFDQDPDDPLRRQRQMCIRDRKPLIESAGHIYDSTVISSYF